MDAQFTNSRDSITLAARDDTNWASLSRSEQIRSIELEGYAVIPDVLVGEQVRDICGEMNRLPTTAVDYSECQRVHGDVQWTESPTTIDVIALPAVVDFLAELLGDDLICTSVSYALSLPGHPGIAIHTDAQPYGSKIFGMKSSSPVLLRVLYYLDELTPECSPFKVVPRSHLSLHSDANPYKRYLSHPDERMVTCRAGSAIVINQKVFHGNYPNHGERPRRMLAIAYRPAWSGPIDDVEEYDATMVARLPQKVRPLFGSLNTRVIEFDGPNRPDDMERDAPGISPDRWTRGTNDSHHECGP